jgi:L-serine dehydratase
MPRQRSVFDIVGPVMVGPSSSHTAGACRLGELARAIFGDTPARARIVLHGSFASTGLGHGTDLALVAGLLGMHPDDARLPEAFDLARDRGLEFEVAAADLGDAHPNTALFELEAADGRRMTMQGSSLGGGDILVTRIDDYDVEITGELPLLVVGHMDRLGEIAAVTGILADARINIASMQVSRERRGASALMLIATDAEVDRATEERIAGQPGVTSVRRVSAV